LCGKLHDHYIEVLVYSAEPQSVMSYHKVSAWVSGSLRVRQGWDVERSVLLHTWSDAGKWHFGNVLKYHA